MMSFINSGYEIRIYKFSSGNKLDGVQLARFISKAKSEKSNIFEIIFFETSDH